MKNLELIISEGLLLLTFVFYVLNFWKDETYRERANVIMTLGISAIGMFFVWGWK